MTNPRETRTNAADSAPGVDDGPAGVGAPPVNSKPGGRHLVWIGVLLVCLIVIAAFFARPVNQHEATQGARGPGAAQPEAVQTRAPPNSNG